MKIYAVGGSVRDELLGLPVTDRDFVVVGATPAEMVKLGYKPVGKDFPVFLHPETKEEYALARTERKTARGYHGFEFHAAPDVTLEEDLARRDLTVNALAKDDAGNIIDPFGGVADLKARVLRHVGPAFAEDPVRILRVARFAARFDFSIAPTTLQLMREMVVHGEASALVAERVWQELARGLMEREPSRMFRVLTECGAAAVVLMEKSAAEKQGLKPMARLVSYGFAGVDPKIMGIGPVPASKIALDKAGLKVSDMDVIEANEAFAVQAMAVACDLQFDSKKTNPNGGAVGLGHPIGATGALITIKALYELQRIGGKYALVTMCIGGGQGIAAVYERMN